MNPIINATLKTLDKSRHLLKNLDDEHLKNKAVPPYYSSIGSHMRHILDFYQCIFNENNGVIDLTIRERNPDVEICCEKCSGYLDHIQHQLRDYTKDLDTNVFVIDDLGAGKIKMTYTLSALFAQANSHTIHHYAIINYILDHQNIEMKDAQFGYNPTTPQEKTILN